MDFCQGRAELPNPEELYEILLMRIMSRGLDHWENYEDLHPQLQWTNYRTKLERPCEMQGTLRDSFARLRHSCLAKHIYFYNIFWFQLHRRRIPRRVLPQNCYVPRLWKKSRQMTETKKAKSASLYPSVHHGSTMISRECCKSEFRDRKWLAFRIQC